jgi:hypothetical protein
MEATNWLVFPTPAQIDGRSAGGQLGIGAQLLPEEIANTFERLVCSLEREVGGENVDHSRPSVEVDSSAFALQTLGVTNGIVKKNIVFADMHHHGRQSNKVSI